MKIPSFIFCFLGNTGIKIPPFLPYMYATQRISLLSLNTRFSSHERTDTSLFVIERRSLNLPGFAIVHQVLGRPPFELVPPPPTSPNDRKGCLTQEEEARHRMNRLRRIRTSSQSPRTSRLPSTSRSVQAPPLLIQNNAFEYLSTSEWITQICLTRSTGPLIIRRRSFL